MENQAAISASSASTAISSARERGMSARIGFHTNVAISFGIRFISSMKERLFSPTIMAPFCITCQWNIAEITVAMSAPMPSARMLP